MPLQLQPIPSVNFINPEGVLDVADAELFASEESMDTAIDALVPDKDKPYLTQNDKVFATRYAASVEAGPTVFEYDNVPDNTWSKNDIRSWLQTHFNISWQDSSGLTKNELLNMVNDLVG